MTFPPYRDEEPYFDEYDPGNDLSPEELDRILGQEPEGMMDDVTGRKRPNLPNFGEKYGLGDSTLRFAPLRDYPKHILDMFERRAKAEAVRNPNNPWTYEEFRDEARGLNLVTFGNRYRKYAMGLVPPEHEKDEEQVVLMRGAYNPRGRVVTGAVEGRGEFNTGAGRLRPRMTGALSQRQILEKLFTPISTSVDMRKDGETVLDKDGKPKKKHYSTDPMEIFFAATDKGDIYGHGKFTQRGLGLEQLFGHGMPFVDLDIASEMNPTVLRALKGASAMPKVLVAQRTNEDGTLSPFLQKIPPGMSTPLMQEAMAKAGGGFYAKGSTMYRATNYRASEVPYNVGDPRYLTTWKDARRPLRGTNRISERTLAEEHKYNRGKMASILPMTTGTSRFPTQVPHAGTMQRMLFVDDQSLFAEGGAYMQRGRRDVVSMKSWRIGTPGLNEVDFQANLAKGLEAGELSAGSVFGVDKGSAERLAKMTGYRLKRGMTAQVLGGRWEDRIVNGQKVEGQDYWLDMALHRDAAEGTELKTVAGMKYMTTPVTSHPLFEQTGADIMAPLPAVKKGSRIMTIFNRAFQALPWEEQMKWMQEAAAAEGYKGNLAPEKGMFSGDASNVMYRASAMWAQTRRRVSDPFEQRFSTDMLRLMKKQKPEAFKEKFGNLRISSKPTQTIKDYTVDYYDLEMPTSMRSTTTSGKAALSPMFMDFLRRQSPENYGRLTKMFESGKFGSPHRQHFISYAATQLEGYGARIPRLDVNSEEAAPLLEQYRKLVDEYAQEYDGALQPAMRKAMGAAFKGDKRALSIGGTMMPSGGGISKLMKQMGSQERQGWADEFARYLYKGTLGLEEESPEILGEHFRTGLIASVSPLLGGQGLEGLAKMAQTRSIPALSGVAMGRPELPTNMIVSDPKATLRLLKDMASSDEEFEALKKQYEEGNLYRSVVKAQIFEAGTTLPEARIVPPRFAEKYMGISTRPKPLAWKQYATKSKSAAEQRMIDELASDIGMSPFDDEGVPNETFWKTAHQSLNPKQYGQFRVTPPKGGMLISQLLFGGMNRDFDGDRLAALIMGSTSGPGALNKSLDPNEMDWQAKGVGQENVKYAEKAMASGGVYEFLGGVAGGKAPGKPLDLVEMIKAGLNEYSSVAGMGASYNPLATAATMSAEVANFTGLSRTHALDITNRAYASVYQQYMDKEPPTDPRVNEWLARTLTDVSGPNKEIGAHHKYKDVPFKKDRHYGQLDLVKQSLDAFSTFAFFGQDTEDVQSYAGAGAHPGLVGAIAQQLIPIEKIDDAETVRRVTEALRDNYSNRKERKVPQQIAHVVQAIQGQKDAFPKEMVDELAEIMSKRTLTGSNKIRVSYDKGSEFEKLPSGSFAEYIPKAFLKKLDPRLAENEADAIARANMLQSTQHYQTPVDNKDAALREASKIRTNEIVDFILQTSTGWTPRGANVKKAAIGPSMMIASTMANAMKEFPKLRPDAKDKTGAKHPHRVDFEELVGHIPTRWKDNRVKGLRTKTVLHEFADKITDARTWEAVRRGQVSLRQMLEFSQKPEIAAVIDEEIPSFKEASGSILGDLMDPKDMGFARGGYTGTGQLNEPAGIVHKGEHVVPRHMVHAIEQGNPDAIQRLIGQIQNPNKRLEPEGASFAPGPQDADPPPMPGETRLEEMLLPGGGTAYGNVNWRLDKNRRMYPYSLGSTIPIPNPANDFLDVFKKTYGSAPAQGPMAQAIADAMARKTSPNKGSTSTAPRPTIGGTPISGVDPHLYAWDTTQEDMLFGMAQSIGGILEMDPEGGFALLANEMNRAFGLDMGGGESRTADAIQRRLQMYGIDFTRAPAPQAAPVAQAAPAPQAAPPAAAPTGNLSAGMQKYYDMALAGKNLNSYRQNFAVQKLVAMGLVQDVGGNLQLAPEVGPFPSAPMPGIAPASAQLPVPATGPRVRSRAGTGLRAAGRANILSQVGSRPAPPPPMVVSAASASVNATVSAAQAAATLGIQISQVPPNASGRVTLGAVMRYASQSMGPSVSQMMGQTVPPPLPGAPASPGPAYNVAMGAAPVSAGPAAGINMGASYPGAPAGSGGPGANIGMGATPAQAPPPAGPPPAAPPPVPPSPGANPATPFAGMNAQQVHAALSASAQAAGQTPPPFFVSQAIAGSGGPVPGKYQYAPGVQAYMSSTGQPAAPHFTVNAGQPMQQGAPRTGNFRRNRGGAAGGAGGAGTGTPGAAPGASPGRWNGKKTFLREAKRILALGGTGAAEYSQELNNGGRINFNIDPTDDEALDLINSLNYPGQKAMAAEDESFAFLQQLSRTTGLRGVNDDIDLVTRYLDASEAERVSMPKEEVQGVRAALWRVNQIGTAQGNLKSDQAIASVSKMGFHATDDARGVLASRAKRMGLKESSPEAMADIARKNRSDELKAIGRPDAEAVTSFTNALNAVVKPLQDLEKTTKGVEKGFEDYIDTSQKISNVFGSLIEQYDRAEKLEALGQGNQETQAIRALAQDPQFAHIFSPQSRQRVADLQSETQKAVLKKQLAPDTFSESMEKASVKLFSQLYTLNAVRRFVTAPMQRNADLYESGQIDRSVMLSQITSTPLSESGFAGTVLRRQTDTARLNRAMGQSYYNAWSPLMSGFASAAQGSGGAAGFLGSVGLPAVIGGATIAKGIGAFGSLLGPTIAGAATPIALGAAGLIAGVGTYNTFVSNRDNISGMGRFAEDFYGKAGDPLGQFGSILSDIPSAIQYMAAGQSANKKLVETVPEGNVVVPTLSGAFRGAFERLGIQSPIDAASAGNPEAANMALWFRGMQTFSKRGRGYNGFDNFTDLTRASWEQQFPGRAYPLSDIETAGLESDAFTERLRDTGISDTFGEKEGEIINDLFGALSRSGGTANYSNRQISTIGEMVQLGLKPVDFANSIAMRRGRNLAFAPDEREDLLKEIAARIQNRPNGVTIEDILGQMDVDSQFTQELRTRGMRYGTGGMQRMESLVGSVDQADIPATLASLNMAETSLMYGQLPQMQGIMTNAFARRQAEVNSGINLEANTQFMQMAQEAYGSLSQRMLLGADSAAGQRFGDLFEAGGLDRQMLMTAALNGDMRSLSALDNTVGGRFSMYNNQTGRRSMFGRLNAAQVANLRQVNPTLAGLIRDPSVLEMGERDIGNQQAIDQQRQFDISIQQNQIQRTMAEGLAGGVGATMDSRGFVSGGTMSPLKTIAEQFGMKWLVGNGMTPWEVEQNQLLLRREQQDFSIGQQGRQMAMGWAQYAQAGQQFSEKYALNLRQFDYGIGRQREQQQIQDAQRGTRYEWQAEDFSYQRSQRDLGFGWQMEDYDRDIRYARGRQKRDLIRQRERSVISYSMESGRQDTMEDRAEKEKQWTEEQVQREKDQFEQNVRFQREEMEMQKRHFEEGRKFDLQSLQMQQEAFNKNVAWMQQERALEDQSFLLSRQNQMLQIEMNKQFGVELDAIATRAQDYANALQLINQFYEDVIALANSNQILQIINGLVGGFFGGIAAGGGTTGGGTTGGGTPVPNQLPPGAGQGPFGARDARYQEATLKYLEQMANREARININIDAREANSARYASRIIL